MKLEELKRLINEACGDYDAQQQQEPQQEPQHGGFSGEEKASGGKMARTDLVTIAKDAQELLNMFGDDAELPDWVESKLTKASDYLNSVKKYIGGEIVRQQTGLMEEVEPIEEQREVYLYLEDATYDDGTPVEEDVEFWDDVVMEAEYQGRKVTLNKPMQGDVKKSKVYVKNEKGNVIKVNFGDPNMKIKKSNPKRRKSFRARHNCDNPGPKTKARYWSCRAW